MSDLSEFLLARIAEDEAVARGATEGPWEPRPYWFTSDGRSWANVPDVINEDIDATDAEHIARWNPSRVLAECEARRRIVEQLWLYVARPDPASSDPSGTQAVWIVKTLAMPYADHPDYREEWRA